MTSPRPAATKTYAAYIVCSLHRTSEEVDRISSTSSPIRMTRSPRSIQSYGLVADSAVHHQRHERVLIKSTSRPRPSLSRASWPKVSGARRATWNKVLSPGKEAMLAGGSGGWTDGVWFQKGSQRARGGRGYGCGECWSSAQVLGTSALMPLNGEGLWIFEAGGSCKI